MLGLLSLAELLSLNIDLLGLPYIGFPGFLKHLERPLSKGRSISCCWVSVSNGCFS